jgi:hypothetical protein
MALEKIMNRCFKLYNMIDGFMKIFKLLEVKRRMDTYLRENPDAEDYEKESRKG